jgi:hypothetical protein
MQQFNNVHPASATGGCTSGVTPQFRTDFQFMPDPIHASGHEENGPATAGPAQTPGSLILALYADPA